MQQDFSNDSHRNHSFQWIWWYVLIFFGGLYCSCGERLSLEAMHNVQEKASKQTLEQEQVRGGIDLFTTMSERVCSTLIPG